MSNPNFTEQEKNLIREQIRRLENLIDSNPNAKPKQIDAWRNEIVNLRNRLTWSGNPDRGF